jgi:dienelactone hydrolase
MKLLRLLLFLPLLAVAQPHWDLARLSSPPATFPSETIQSTNAEIRAVFFEGLPYRGKPTRVFAWIGVPKTATATRKAPGMVLIHGGGGTAYQNWVKLWVDRGYAAIAMDTCGALPEPATAKPRPRHDHSGPPGWGGFSQMNEKPEDQWTYHAVADAVLAHSLLRAQPEVDASRIGLTGISWGGFLTCIVAGVDDRFRFAAPVYGCGHYLETTFGDAVRAIAPDHGERWLAWWDPSRYLPQVKTPMLWVNGSNDFAYWPTAWQKSYRLIPADRRTLALRLRMPHSHGPAGEAPEEIAVFANHVLRGGEPLAAITHQSRADRVVTVKFRSPRPLVKAELNVTADDTSPWPKREWQALPANVKDNVATAKLPAHARFYYVNLFDDRGCVVSSEHEEVGPHRGKSGGR